MTLQKLTQYGKGFQLKVIGALLTDKKFLLDVRDVLYADYFDSEAHTWIIERILEYYDKYHTVITMDVLKVELKKLSTDDILKVAVKEELRNSYQASQDDLEYVEEEFATFCKNQELKAALKESVDHLNDGDYDAIRARIEKAMKAGMDKNLGHEYNKDIESRYRADYRPTIPTPWPTINTALQGGLGPGDLAIVFGNPGGGKSWMMVAMAAHAVKLGYNVNYYTLELGEDYVGKRFDCYFTRIGIDQINMNRKEVEKAVENLRGQLIVKEYAPKMASISTIESHVQKCIDIDHRPDIIIIDYADYLKSPSRGRYNDRKDEIDDVFIASKGLAKKLGVPVITPSQVNRLGAKDDVIEGDKAAGSYDKMMVADVCMSLSRKKEDKIAGTGRIHMMKNRYGIDGMTWDVVMDTNVGHIDIVGEMDAGFMSEDSPGTKVNEIARKFFELENNS